MTKTLIEGIADWLNEGGYPLELYVARTLRGLGFNCSKSPFFNDTETEKPREIDIVASVSAQNESMQTLDTKLIIECKKSTNAFVVLCDSPAEDALLRNVIFGNLSTDNRDDKFVALPFFPLIDSGEKDFSKFFPTPRLNTKCRLGYTLLQAHQKGDSNIYSEIYKLAKARQFEVQKDVEFREEVINDLDSYSREEMENTFYAHVPALVIEAPLVEVYLNDTGETVIEEKEISSIKIRLPWIPEHESEFSIAIITRPLVSDFAQDIITLTNEIVNRHNMVTETSWPEPAA
jgi:hypothetical protein